MHDCSPSSEQTDRRRLAHPRHKALKKHNNQKDSSWTFSKRYLSPKKIQQNNKNQARHSIHPCIPHRTYHHGIRILNFTISSFFHVFLGSLIFSTFFSSLITSISFFTFSSSEASTCSASLSFFTPFP